MSRYTATGQRPRGTVDRAVGRRLGMAVLVVLGLSSAPGCDAGQVAVTSASTGLSYGRGELVAAVARFSKSARAPADYQQFADTVAKLRPSFNEEVAIEAERHLVFLAVHPLDAAFDQPLPAQMAALGTTVWPTILGHPARPDEDAESYGARICAGPMALDCKYIVREYRPLILAAEVWRELEDRARDAMSECIVCSDEPRYKDALVRLDQRERAMTARETEAEDDVQPRAWPRSGDSAAPWSNPVLLVVDSDGGYTLADQTVAPGQLRASLTAQRGEDEGSVLGLYMRPAARIDHLRTVLGDAAATGYREVAIQARAVDYPFELREYRLATSKAGRRDRRVRVRDSETIQVLVQALDAEAGASVLHL
ncbi:MAG: hypothetical protein AAGC55_24975 [Myxococcota bacterium]